MGIYGNQRLGGFVQVEDPRPSTFLCEYFVLMCRRRSYIRLGLILTLLENDRNTVCEFAFLCHKSAATCRIDSNNVSNS